MQFRLLACAVAFAPMFVAQPDRTEATPQMVWHGETAGTTFLYVHAKRLKVEPKDSAAVENQRFRIINPLPLERQDVRLRVTEGRGYVHIVEQPRADNDYTLTVAIEDRQNGSSPYSFSLYWNTGDIRPNERGRNQLKWSGRVEDEVLISCAAAQCRSEAVQGTPVMHERFKIAHPLPQSAIEVKLETRQGRGQIRLVEQPKETNGYTAKVQIKDPESGAGDYDFTLSWKEWKGAPMEPQPSGLGLLWSGRVEGTVRVVVRGGGALSEVVNGRPIAAEHAVFERPLPARTGITPQLKKRQGRGTIEIVEYPTAKNGYQLIFEIRDPGDGADMYEVEVAW